MDKETYHIEIERLIKKVKFLKNESKDTSDEEKKSYLDLAIKSIYREIQKLMLTYQIRNQEEKQIN